MILIGASMGASNALATILTDLPPSLSEAIAVVVHRHRASDHRLIELLQKHSALPIVEAWDNQDIEPGHIYIAPPEYHLLIQRGHFELTVDELVNFARPSIDVLFEAAAEDLGPAAIGVLLTGASSDGAKGLAAIRAAGGTTIVQDPSRSECPIMPAAALALFTPDHVCGLDELPAILVRYAALNQRRRNP